MAFLSPIGPDPRPALGADRVRALHAECLHLADLSRALIQGRRREFSCQTKADGSLVTEVDLATEKLLRAHIERLHPDHGVIGEELPARLPDAEYQWILDPIDGTAEFARGLPYYGTLIAVYFREWPVAGVIDHPDLDLRVSAGYGLGACRNGQWFRLAPLATPLDPARAMIACASRANFLRYRPAAEWFDRVLAQYPDARIFRSCYAHTCAITGMVDAMVEGQVRLWDLGPAPLLIEEAGGRFTLTERFIAADGAEVLSAVFGQAALVDDIVALLPAK